MSNLLTKTPQKGALKFLMLFSTIAFVTTLVFDPEVAFAKARQKNRGPQKTQKVQKRNKRTGPAVPGFFTMYRYPEAAGGTCIKPHSSSAEAILDRNGIDYSGSPAKAEINALAKGIGQVERLLGAPLPTRWQQDYKFMVAGGAWNQGPTTINVRRLRGSGKGTNTGRMMHELGHKVGNSGVYQDYARYTNGTRCRITGYAASKFNEEFAEVFEAYVVHPQMLEKKCPKAYNFFADKLFPNSEARLATCGKSSGGLVAGTDNDPIYDVIPTPRPDPATLVSDKDDDSAEVHDDKEVQIDNDDESEESEDERELNARKALEQGEPSSTTVIPVPSFRPDQPQPVFQPAAEVTTGAVQEAVGTVKQEEKL